MNRYFLEVAYKGTRYAGSQVQVNAKTVQAELERALQIYFRQEVKLTGSSRTDAGVHARQNYYHFDIELIIKPESLYNLNALLPQDIAVNNIRLVKPEAHSRFDAIAREYEYVVYHAKDPFMEDRGYFFPYTLDFPLLETAAAVIPEYTDFTTFSKRNSQVKTFICQVQASEWRQQKDCLLYCVKANRFLRGMVKGLVGTMLQVGRGKITIEGFRKIVENGNSSAADFSVPGHGLYLQRVIYPEGYFAV